MTTKRISKFATLFALTSLVMGAAGCKSVCQKGGVTVCAENSAAGLPIILCQPMDTAVMPGKPAEFIVEVRGAELAYQWHLKREGRDMALEDGEGFKGSQTAMLQVNRVDKNALGLYWCAVRSTACDDGRPTWTETRMASLGITSSGRIMTPLLLQNPVRSSGTTAVGTCPAKCGGNTFNYTGVVVFGNNGLKYRPVSGIANGSVRVSVGGTVISNTQYEVLWRVALKDYCCATKVAGSATDREFPCVSTKAYTFTVYLYPGVTPPDGTPVTMQLMPDGDWQ